jgi:hypothetical protein
MAREGRSLVFLLASASFLFGEQFDLKTPAGTIHVESTIKLDNRGYARLIATATNASDLPIQSAKICITSHSYRKGCLFTFWNQHEWGPGEDISVDVSSDIRVAGPSHLASLAPGITQAVRREPSRFEGVHRIYVEQIDGSNGLMARQQFMAGIANTQRFRAVDKPELADAVVRGMYEVEFDATETDTSRKGGVVALGTATAGDSGAAAAGVGFAAGKSTSLTRQIKFQTATFRLVTPAGIILWGWDDSKPCGTQTRTKCAIDDLVYAAAQ